MELIVLGSGCGIPSLQRGSPGYLIIIDHEPILFDSGSGTLSRLLNFGIDYTQLNFVFYTHTHSDHSADLIPLIQALRTTPNYQRQQILNLYGPEGFTSFLKSLAQAFGPWLLAPDFPLQIHELNRDRLQFSGWTIESIPMQHSRSAIGYRIESRDGRSIAYSGDTDFCPEIIELANQADVLILECSFPESEKVAGHLTPGEAAKIAALSGCKHIILTHFYPPYEKIESEIKAEFHDTFRGKVSIAHDSMRLKI